MRTTFALAATLILPSLAMAQSGGRVERHDNEFTGAQAVQVVEAHFSSSGTISVFKARKNGEPEAAAVTLYFDFRDWTYIKCHQVHWLIDGKRVTWPVTWDGSVGKGYVLEHLDIIFSMRDLALLAHAKSVRFQVCNDAFSFSDELLKNIAAVYSAKYGDPKLPMACMRANGCP